MVYKGEYFMSVLHRTQIYLGEDQIQSLKLEAQKERLPAAVLIRQAIDNFLKARTKSTNWDSDPLTQAVGKIKLSVSNASVDHDHYLYR